MLCERLTEELSTLSVHLIRKEREELRKQRLKFVDISVSNILKKQNTKTNRRKGSVTKENGSEAGDEVLAEGFDENEQQMNDENEENIEEKSKNRPKKRRKRVTIEGDDGEEGKEDNEEEDDDESGGDDDIGRAVWSDEEEDDEEEDEEEDKFVAIKSRRNRSRKNINYKFSEFDELIKSAIEQDVEYEYDVSAEDPSAPKLESKGKDMSNIIASNTEELDFSLTPASKPEEQVISDQKLPETDVQTDDNQNPIEIKSTSDEKPAEEQTENKMDVEVKAKEQEEGGEEEQEDEEEESDDNETKSTTNKKRSRRRSSTSARKRHRGLNDLSDTEEEDDDSDEDFKGDDSATEVEEGSDEEFVDDGSTQEDEEVSDESDFKYSRRRSGRNASKASKGGKSRSKGGSKNNARKGYRRDAFVVSSEDSDDYKPGRSSKAKKTRAAARKRISYREETTTEEESEEEYYWNSNKNKSKTKSRKGRAGSESSSEEEWGGRKAAKDKKKSKNSSEEEDDEEEDEEEEDNDDNNDDKEDSEQSDKEVVGAKPGPKSSKPAPPRPLSMKGKPRLSKAKGLLNLKEPSDEEDSELKTPKSKKSKVVSDSEEEEELKDNKSGDNPQTGAQSVDKISGNNNKQSVNQLNDQNFETKSKPIESLEKMVSNSGLNSSELTLKKTLDNNQLLNSSDPISVHKTTVPHLLAQQLNSYPSAAMKTTLPSDINSIKQNISHNSRDISFDKNSNQLPNNQNNNNIDEYYSLTPLDAYPTGPPPLKPTIVADSYVQQSSPPRILTLESTPSTPYPRHPHMDYATVGHPMPGPPNAHIDPRVEHPFMAGHPVPPNMRGMPPFTAHQPNLRPELRPSHGGPPVQGFGPIPGGIPRSPYGYPPAPPTGHPYYSRPPIRPHEPPFNAGPHARPPNSPMGGPLPPRTTAPTTTSSMTGQPPPSGHPPNFRPMGPHGWNPNVPNRGPLPGYNFGASHPPHPSAGPPYYPQQPLAAHPPPHHVVSLPPGAYPPGHYPQNYGYFGPNPGSAASPNGAFMIQNLLQHRPPAPEDTPHPTPGSAPTSTAASTPTTSSSAVTAANTTNTISSVASGPPPPAHPPPRELRTGTNDSFSTY